MAWAQKGPVRLTLFLTSLCLDLLKLSWYQLLQTQGDLEGFLFQEWNVYVGQGRWGKNKPGIADSWRNAINWVRKFESSDSEKQDSAFKQAIFKLNYFI